MNQTRRQSLVEALVNTAIGFVVSFLCQLWIMPLVGVKVTLAQDLAIISLFTVVSVARQYVIRRWFNAKLVELAQRLSGAT